MDQLFVMNNIVQTKDTNLSQVKVGYIVGICLSMTYNPITKENEDCYKYYLSGCKDWYLTSQLELVK